MRPKKQSDVGQQDLFRNRLDKIIGYCVGIGIKTIHKVIDLREKSGG